MKNKIKSNKRTFLMFKYMLDGIEKGYYQGYLTDSYGDRISVQHYSFIDGMETDIIDYSLKSFTKLFLFENDCDMRDYYVSNLRGNI